MIENDVYKLFYKSISLNLDYIEQLKKIKEELTFYKDLFDFLDIDINSYKGGSDCEFKRRKKKKNKKN